MKINHLKVLVSALFCVVLTVFMLWAMWLMNVPPVVAGLLSSLILLVLIRLMVSVISYEGHS